MKKVIWIDTETTGLNSQIHGVREVGFIIEIDGVEVEKGFLEINTMTYENERYISKYVRKEMGVDEELLTSYPSSSYQQITFENILHKYVNTNEKSKFQMAGFNIEFDYDFIKKWFDDTPKSTDFNVYFGYQKLDVLELVRHLRYLNIFKTQNNKLETLCKHFDIEIDAHQALSDIEATKELHTVLADRYIKRS